MKNHGFGDRKSWVLGSGGSLGTTLGLHMAPLGSKGAQVEKRTPKLSYSPQDRALSRGGKVAGFHPKGEKNRFWCGFLGVQDAAHIFEPKMLKKGGPGTWFLLFKHNK